MTTHPRATTETKPPRAGLTLTTLILVAAAANLPLSVANVALPQIGVAFDASQTSLNLIAIGYSLGLAASVLYLGALGDRYGRKMMLILGAALSIPACVLCAWAPSGEVLVAARILGGVAAGMAYPTTLALITALWGGQGRTKAIALWSAVGGAVMALGPLIAGALLEQYWWGSVFLISLPLSVIAMVMAWKLVPSHVNESSEAVDNLGGVLSIVVVGTLVLGISFAPVAGQLAFSMVLFAVSIACVILFLLRQKRVANPLYDLDVARRRIFWVAAVGGIIVFGSLMGAMFVGQQYLQNVLGYSTLVAGSATLPAAFFMVLVAPRSAVLIAKFGSRFTLLVGYALFLAGFLVMLVGWTETSSFAMVAAAYSLVGVGVGLAGTPASHSLTGSVPVHRAGMASGTADLQRDLGGAIMQAIQGALLTAGYATAIAASVASASATVSAGTEAQLQKSFASAESIAQAYPQYATQISEAAKSAFLAGANWAYAAGIVAVLIGAALVFFCFPKKEEEVALLQQYELEDAQALEGVL